MEDLFDSPEQAMDTLMEEASLAVTDAARAYLLKWANYGLRCSREAKAIEKRVRERNAWLAKMEEDLKREWAEKEVEEHGQ